MANRVVKVEYTVASWKNAMQEFDTALRNGGGIGFDISALSKDKQRDFMNVVQVKGVLLSGNKQRPMHISK